MINIIVELSKYIIVILMAAYTFSCFSIFAQNYEDDEKRVLVRQNVLMFTLDVYKRQGRMCDRSADRNSI